jgi:hypothetical protein
MNIVYKNLEEYACVVRAWRLAYWASHAWGQLTGEQIAEVWNICPSLKAFCDLLPGYAIAKGWITEGPCGYGVVGPEYDAGSIVVWVGSNAQVTARFKPSETTISYAHGYVGSRLRYAQATVADGMVVGAEGYMAAPRYWARLARLLIITEQPTDLVAAGIMEYLRNMVGEEPAAQEEFDKYFALNGPEILAGPEVIMVERR